jgi:hypothetical protein
MAQMTVSSATGKTTTVRLSIGATPISTRSGRRKIERLAGRKHEEDDNVLGVLIFFEGGRSLGLVLAVYMDYICV